MTTEPASWVIRVKETKEVVCETFNEETVRNLDTETFEAVPILQYLQDFNRSIREADQLKEQTL